MARAGFCSLNAHVNLPRMSDIFTTATLTTERLRLEPFAPRHAPALNAINREPKVRELLITGDPETLQQTEDAVTRVQARWQTLGYGWWAVITRATDTVIGAVCAQNVANEAGAEIELGWRLATAATGKGYATEAGKAAARYAFDVIGVDHVIAVAHPDNAASHRVMERVGMTYRGREVHYGEDCTSYVLHKADHQ